MRKITNILIIFSLLFTLTYEPILAENNVTSNDGTDLNTIMEPENIILDQTPQTATLSEEEQAIATYMEQMNSVQQANQSLAEQEGKLTISQIIDEFGVTESSIQNKLDTGKTLSQIYVALVDENESFSKEQSSLSRLNPVMELQTIEIPESTNPVTSDYGDNVDLTLVNLFSQVSMESSESMMQQTTKQAAASVVPEPEIRQVTPKINEAPYQTSLHDDTISFLSGSLSTSETDLTLPGRNGLGFALTRTYNSSGSQFYDTGASYTYASYTVSYATRVQTDTVGYSVSYTYDKYLQTILCSTGNVLSTTGSGQSYTTSATFSTYNAAISASVPSIASDTVHSCGEIGTDKKYIYTYSFRSKSSPSEYITDSSSVGSSGTAGPYYYYSDAQVVQSTINSNANTLLSSIKNGSDNQVQYYIRTYTSSSPNAQIKQSGSNSSRNTVYTPDDENRYPIGKGWSWNIPYVATYGGKQYVNLGESGSYEISGTYLKGYPWKDLQFVSNTSVQVNNIQSQYALQRIDGTKMFFASDGKLLQISDAYNNTVTFKYVSVSPYGQVLTTITDAIGNMIQISYTTTKVTLTSGLKTVVYNKISQNGKEMLTSVVNPLGQSTSYTYDIASAKFNNLGTTPITDNPYALLKSISHPTGARTVFHYETEPITRFVATNKVNQVYRLHDRSEELTEGGQKTTYNEAFVTYPQDMGATYTTTGMSISSNLFTTDTMTNYTFRKVFPNEDVAPQYYLTNVDVTGVQQSNLSHKTIYTYDEVKGNPNPINTESYTEEQTSTTTTTQTPHLITSTTYDDYGNLLTSIDERKNKITNVYNSSTHLLDNSTLSSATNGSTNLFTSLTRNGLGSVTKVEVRDNPNSSLLRKQEYGYDIYGNTISIIRENGENDQITTINYDNTTHAFPIQMSSNYTDMDGTITSRAISATYDNLTGNLLTYIDANQNTTTYTYDALNRIKTVKNPDLTLKQYTYDDINNELTTTDELGKKTKSKWNALGWFIEQDQYEAGQYTKKSMTSYNLNGSMLWAEDALANRVTYAYDDWGRVIKVTQPNQGIVSTTYNDMAREVVSTDAEGNQSKTKTNIYGQTITTAEKRGVSGNFTIVSQQTYDQQGRLKTVGDALNYSNITYSYDSLGQLLTVTQAYAEGANYSYKYDMLGNQTVAKDPTSTTTMEYDELGQLVKQVDQNGMITKYGYDKNGNLTKKIDRNQNTLYYQYNSRNWLVSKSVAGEPVIGYTYNADGTRANMTEATDTTSYSYNSDTGEVTSITYPDGKILKMNSYDANGRLTQMIDPANKIIDYSYSQDGLYQVKVNNQLKASYDYYKNGLTKTTILGNGITTIRTYDGLYLSDVVDKKTSNGLILNSYHYQTDNRGNIDQTIINLNASGNGQSVTSDFTYDSQNRITTASPNNEVYNYDSRGNRQTLKSDQLVLPTSARNSYDAWNRLKSVTTTDGHQVKYTYNGDDLLVSRTENGITTRYYYLGSDIIAEGTVAADGSVTITSSFIRGNGLISKIDTSTNMEGYYLFNGHGDVMEMRDTTGLLINAYDYDIWGNPVASIEQVSYPVGTMTNPFRYSGEFWDESADLQYLRARWYAPSLGRFINEDTYQGDITNPLSQNLYTYVHNNPLIYSDPSGHWCTSSDGKWAHSGACSDPTSIYSDDMLHDGGQMRFDGYEPAGAIYQYPIELRYARWYAGDASAYEGASESDKQQLIRMAKSDWTWGEAFTWFSAGVLTGFSLAFPSAGLASLEVASTGTFTYNAATVSGGASVFVTILKGAKTPGAVPALNKLAQSALEKGNTYITGIIRSDGTIEAHLNVGGLTTSHKALGLAADDVGFNMSYYDGRWNITGSGFAGANNWPAPSPAQIDMLKTLFGVN